VEYDVFTEAKCSCTGEYRRGAEIVVRHRPIRHCVCVCLAKERAPRWYAAFGTKAVVANFWVAVKLNDRIMVDTRIYFSVNKDFRHAHIVVHWLRVVQTIQAILWVA